MHWFTVGLFTKRPERRLVAHLFILAKVILAADAYGNHLEHCYHSATCTTISGVMELQLRRSNATHSG